MLGRGRGGGGGRKDADDATREPFVGDVTIQGAHTERQWGSEGPGERGGVSIRKLEAMTSQLFACKQTANLELTSLI